MSGHWWAEPVFACSNWLHHKAGELGIFVRVALALVKQQKSNDPMAVPTKYETHRDKTLNLSRAEHELELLLLQIDKTEETNPTLGLNIFDYDYFTKKNKINHVYM